MAYPGRQDIGWYVQSCGMGETLGWMTYSGVFERYPNLHVMTEGYAGWLAFAMQFYDHHFSQSRLHELGIDDLMGPAKIDVHPSYYLKRQTHATFMWDPLAIRNRDLTGLDCLMWGNDYPHHEGSFPFSADWIEKQFDGVPAAEVDQICRGNAAEISASRSDRRRARHRRPVRLDDKAALVTGAGKGIGRGIALAFAQAGSRCGARRPDQRRPRRGRRGDPRFGAQCGRRFRRRHRDRHAGRRRRASGGPLGGLDILVNNAGGVEQLGTYTAMTVAILENAFRFNVSAPFELGRLALPHMLARGGGAIVNIGSMSGMQNERGFLPTAWRSRRSASSPQLAAIELAPRVRVNAILPGCIETEALRGFMDAMPDVRAGCIQDPMRRNGTPEDIAAAALFFASPAASWITGKLLEVDGAAPGGLFPNESPDL